MAKKPKVIIYSLPSCVFCQQAKAYFRHHGIKYEDVDVSSDLKSQQDMVVKSGQTSTPVIDINGQIIVGFQKNTLDALLPLS